MILVGVDVGGTFADPVLAKPGPRRAAIRKDPSMLEDPSVGAVEGILGLCRSADMAPDGVAPFLHGTTIATNAALRHRGAECGMITTRGCRDVLHIARRQRPQHRSIQQRIPWQDTPLVKRRHRYVAGGSAVMPLPQGKVPFGRGRA